MPSVGRNQYPHEGRLEDLLILKPGRWDTDISGV
jgi:hypothetical protein